MSVKVMAEVFKHSQATLGARLVLLAIADCVDEETRTGWPSVPLLARKARLDARNVQRAIKRLVRLKELRVEGRPLQSNLYVVLDLGGGAGATGDESPPPAERHPPGGETYTPLVALAPPRTVSEPSREPSLSLGFQTFWKPYPKKRHKPDAWKAWRQVDGDNRVEAIVSGVQCWTTSQAWQRGYIEDPATFLRQRQWEDEPVAGHQDDTTAQQVARIRARLTTKGAT